MMAAKCIQSGIEIAFKNHIYWYHGDLYKQLRGGAIGARLTGVVARIVMDHWEKRLRQILEKNSVEVFLFGKYVDDVNTATSVIRKGSRWAETEEGWRLQWDP